MFVSSASKRYYVPVERSSHVRRMSEYNPLYDTFQLDTTASQDQNQSDFQSMTPPKVRLMQNTLNNIDNTYDQPRSYRYNDDNEQRQHTSRQRQRSSCYQSKVESTQNNEIAFLMERVGGTTTRNEDLERCQQQTNRKWRRILSNTFDFLAILTTSLIFALIYVFVKPVQRGFFCDDTSIQYPFRPDTVPMWLLGVYGGVVPIIIFCCVELWVVRPFHCRRGRAGTSLRQRQTDYVKMIFHTVFLFLLGVAVCFLITEVGKRTIGRLRPYYLTICNPVWANLNCTKTVTTASGPVIIPQYIIHHNCNSSVPKHELREAKLSFPSGHSSYSTYAFTFLFVYFEVRLVCPNVQFFKPFLQSLCVAIAFFTCLSRVTDHKHHATDVIGGALIGFCIALFSAVRVGTYLWTVNVYFETDEKTKKGRIPIPDARTQSSDVAPTNEQNVPVTEREHIFYRSNYDNVVSMQPQQQEHPPVSNIARVHDKKRTSFGKRYDEGNV